MSFIEKIRRVRFHRSKVVKEESTTYPAGSLCLPENVICAPDGVCFRYTPGDQADVYEIWEAADAARMVA